MQDGFFKSLSPLGEEAGSGILSCRGRGVWAWAAVQSCLAGRGFLVFIKILGLSFQIAPLAMTGL